MIFSFLMMPLLILFQKMKWVAPVSYLKALLIQQLSVISIVISFFIAFLFMQRYFVIQFDISIHYMILMLLLMTSAILLRYVYQELVWEYQIINAEKESIERKDLNGDALNERAYSLSLKLLENYAERVHTCLQERKLYLKPGLSVELLAQETKVPRHHLSELFNTYWGKSFYRVIAEYRIENAIVLLKENKNDFTIEALAYESGFNSKTSFNKYFKEITGFLPSDFRNQQSA